jgi:transglutaminase-like putative cysteine protease
LQNKTNRLVKKSEFWTYAPVEQTATQKCTNIESTHPYKLIKDDLGNQILHFTFDNLPPYATKVIRIKTDLLLADSPNPLRDLNVKGFLQAGKYIESDSPELIRLAEALKTKEPAGTAAKLFNWVSTQVKYSGYLRGDRGALYALRNKKGDCTEFMYLFAALCRANDIPARGVGGYLCNGNSVLKPSEYHNWVEFYDRGLWRIADPQRKVLMEDTSDYMAMRIIDESPENPMGNYHRFRFSGDGLKVKMNR